MNQTEIMKGFESLRNKSILLDQRLSFHSNCFDNLHNSNDPNLSLIRNNLSSYRQTFTEMADIHKNYIFHVNNGINFIVYK
jgi:hypothetical protein